MLNLLTPEWVLDHYAIVTPKFLHSIGVRLVLADLDFTLAPRSQELPDEAVAQWCASLAENGIRILVLSNNRKRDRTKRFCSPLGIPYIVRAGKPGLRGYRRAMRRIGVSAVECAMLGDKLLTDTLGAHRSGIRMLMVEPCGGAKTWWQKVLHAMQEPFKRRSENDRRGKNTA